MDEAQSVVPDWRQRLCEREVAWAGLAVYHADRNCWKYPTTRLSIISEYDALFRHVLRPCSYCNAAGPMIDFSDLSEEALRDLERGLQSVHAWDSPLFEAAEAELRRRGLETGIQRALAGPTAGPGTRRPVGR